MNAVEVVVDIHYDSDVGITKSDDRIDLPFVSDALEDNDIHTSRDVDAVNAAVRSPVDHQLAVAWWNDLDVMPGALKLLGRPDTPEFPASKIISGIQ